HQFATLVGCIDPQRAPRQSDHELYLFPCGPPTTFPLRESAGICARCVCTLARGWACLSRVRDGSASLSSPTQRGLPSARIYGSGLDQHGTHWTSAPAPGRIVQPEAASATLRATIG